MGFTDWFSKNGPATVFLEGLPVVGYVVAAGQGIAGNTDEARRAAIRSTTGLITTVGAVAGTAVAGPGGAALGAGLGKGLGIALEKATKDTVAPEARRGLGEQDLASGSIEIVTSVAGGGMGGVGSALGSAITGSTVGSAVASTATSTVFSGKVVVDQFNKNENERK